MILDRATYKLIEMHFKTYTADKEYVLLKSKEIAENITSVPGGANKRQSAAPDPTARKAIRIEREVGTLKDWLEVIESTVSYFDDESRNQYGNTKNGKGEYIRLVYFKDRTKYSVMSDLEISEGTFFMWRRDVLNRAAILASRKGLID